MTVAQHASSLHPPPETAKQGQTHTEAQTQTHRHTDTQTDRYTHTHTKKKTQTNKHAHTHTHTHPPLKAHGIALLHSKERRSPSGPGPWQRTRLPYQPSNRCRVRCCGFKSVCGLGLGFRVVWAVEGWKALIFVCSWWSFASVAP